MPETGANGHLRPHGAELCFVQGCPQGRSCAGDAGGRGCGGAPTGLTLNSSLPRRAAGSQGSRSPRSSWLLSAPGAAGCRPRPWRGGQGDFSSERRWRSRSQEKTLGLTQPTSGSTAHSLLALSPKCETRKQDGLAPPAARLSPGSQPGQHGLIFPGRCGPRPGTPTLLPHIQGSAQGPGVTCDFSKHLLAGEVAGLPGPQPVLPPPPNPRGRPGCGPGPPEAVGHEAHLSCIHHGTRQAPDVCTHFVPHVLAAEGG